MVRKGIFLILRIYNVKSYIVIVKITAFSLQAEKAHSEFCDLKNLVQRELLCSIPPLLLSSTIFLLSVVQNRAS